MSYSSTLFFYEMRCICLGATEQERGAELLHFAGYKANNILKQKSYWEFCLIWNRVEEK